MTTFTLLATLAGAALGVNVLAFLTARANAYVRRLDQDQEGRQISSPPLQVAAEPTASPPAVSIPDCQTAAYWWKRLFTPQAILGLVLIPLEIYIVVVNSHLLATTLETLFDSSGQPLISLLLYGWEREITNFDLIGALISISQLIAASAMHIAWRELRLRALSGLLLAALSSFIIFEVSMAFYRGFVIDGTLVNAGLSAVLAFGLATLEAAVGIFVIDYFFQSLLLAVVWSIAIPFRGIAHWWARRQRTHALRSYNPYVVAPAVVYPLAALDQVLMEPLRQVDRFVARALPDNKPQLRGQNDVTRFPLDQPEEDRPLSDNGLRPDRMWPSGHQSVQVADRLDQRA